jgi:S1-C subfamily serine protease
MDTTGGNSGSPVLNASGELIGVNFDRAFEATGTIMRGIKITAAP